MRPIQPKTPLGKKTAPPTRPKPPKTPSNGQNNGSAANKEPVQVFCRLRPLDNYADLVAVHRVPTNNTLLRLTAANGSRGDLFYKFKQVFVENTPQNEIFGEIAFPLVTDLVNGKNGLLFTYGITSSGKTYTIAGTPAEPGILPRALDVLFNTLIQNQIQSRKHVFKPDGSNHFVIQSTPDAILQAQREQREKMILRSTPVVNSTPSSARTPRSTRKRENVDEWDQRVKESVLINDINRDNYYAIFVSYVEIYNNYIYDLLDESTDYLKVVRQPQSKVLREDARRRVFVNAGTEVEVKSADEAFELFIKGVRRRRTAHTNLNSESSRSHSVFTIRVVQAPIDANGAEVIQDDRFLTSSQLSIVDLAGSERTYRTKNTDNRLREAGNINNSLMGLRTCIDILRENQMNGSNKVVPYRDNKLTHLFKSYFEGEGKVKMIICVNPSADNYEETVHVMKFAEHSQDVLVSKSVNRFNFQTMPKLMDNMLAVDLAAINVVGPPLPNCFLEDPEDDKVFPEWLECLEQRKRNKELKFEVHKQNQLIVRQRVAEMERENMYLKQQLTALQMDLAVREGQIKDYENKCCQSERYGDSYQKKITDMERNLRAMQQSLDDKCQELSQSELEKERMKAKMRDRLDSERGRLKTVFERILAEKQSQLEREQCVAKDKMNLVKQILNADTNADDYYKDYLLAQPSHSALRQSCAPSAPSNGGGVDSQASTQTPQQAFRSRKSEYDLATNSTPQTVGSLGGDAATPVHNPPPVSNPRHRRSLSTGNEKWIDHRPPGTIELGTVLRPKIKNKKSVSNLKSSDIQGASMYALTHHEADGNGQVETQVFKGEVIPSATGGAQVIFNDVETLKQGSPPQRKRTQSDTRLLSPAMPPNQVITSAELHNHPVFSKRSRR